MILLTTLLPKNRMLRLTNHSEASIQSRDRSQKNMLLSTANFHGLPHVGIACYLLTYLLTYTLILLVVQLYRMLKNINKKNIWQQIGGVEEEGSPCTSYIPSTSPTQKKVTLNFQDFRILGGWWLCIILYLSKIYFISIFNTLYHEFNNIFCQVQILGHPRH